MKDGLSDFPVLFFPHCRIAESDVKKLVPFFGSLTLCQPWFMELSLPGLEPGISALVRTLRPPASLKPREDFNRLLSEYQSWIRQNQDKGYVAFLKASRRLESPEETQWGIRQWIRRGSSASSTEDRALKWHLLLHLAAKIEGARQETRLLLDRLRQIRSPLEEALGEGRQIQGFFDDLCLPDESDPFMDGQQVGRIMEAWFALFGETLKQYRVLITLDPGVMRYVTELFEKSEEETTSSLPQDIRLRLPDLSHLSAEELWSAQGDWRRDREAFASLLTGLLREEGLESGGERRLLRGAKDRFSSDSDSPSLFVTLRNLPRVPGNGQGGRDPLREGVSGKILVLLEDYTGHE